MSIRLSIQAEDAEVERLLAFLQTQDNLFIEDKVSLLERALKWLRASMEGTYDLNPDSGAVLQLDVDARAQGVSEHVDMLSART